MSSSLPSSPDDRTGPDRSQLRLAVVSSFLGSAIEYYDFLLYAVMSGLVFGALFFSGLDPVAGTIASFGTLAFGYFARPLGGVLFGHFGDRIGRKKMLLLSLVLMSCASILIGCLPTSQQIGGFAAVALVLLRLVQGIALGGEWGGSVLITGEHAGRGRNIWTSFTSAGAPAGSLLASGAIALTGALMTPEQFLAWGWRIPFLASAVLLAVGLLVRYRLQESPVFTQAVEADGGRHRFPIGTVLAHHWRPVLAAVGFTLGHFVLATAVNAFVVAFGATIGLDRQMLVGAVAASGAISLLMYIVWGAVSDRIGRRVMLTIGNVAILPWGFALFLAFDTRSFGWILAALVFANVFSIGIISATSTAVVPELFPTEVRYSGASLAFQLSSALGGLAPLIFTSILSATGGDTLPIAFIIAGFGILGIASVFAIRETAHVSLDHRLGDPKNAALNTATQAARVN